MSETSHIKFAGANSASSGIKNIMPAGAGASLKLPVNGYKTGNSSEFTRLDLSPPPASWWENDAIVAYDADGGVRQGGLAFVESGIGTVPIPQDATQALPEATFSIPMAGNGTVDTLYTVTLDRDPRPNIAAADFTMDMRCYFTVTPASTIVFQIELRDTSGYVYLGVNLFATNMNVYRSNGAPGQFSINGNSYPSTVWPLNQWFRVRLTVERSLRRFRFYIDETLHSEATLASTSQLNPITLPVTAEYAPRIRKAINGNAYFDRFQVVPRII